MSYSPTKGDRRGLRSMESRVFMALVLGTTVFFLWMVRHFLPPVFWAVIFAILFQPLYVRIRAAVGGRAAIASLLTTLIVTLVVGIPAALLLAAVAQQGLTVYQRVSAGDIDIGAPLEFVERVVPRVTGLVERYGIDADRIRLWLQDAAVTGSQWMAARLLSLGQNTVALAALFALMLYILFFFFRDGDRIVQGLIRALPMGDERERRLFRRFAEVSRATVKGTLVVAVVQGALGGILFSIVGIQAAVFWGVLMGVLSVLPAVGPALVWVPAAIYLFATGSIVKGLVVTAGGTAVVSLADNVLRPLLVGRETKMPDYLVLVATLGGLAAFGIAGFVAGPIVAALVLVMWEIFTEEYRPDAHGAGTTGGAIAIAASPAPAASTYAETAPVPAIPSSSVATEPAADVTEPDPTDEPSRDTADPTD